MRTIRIALTLLLAAAASGVWAQQALQTPQPPEGRDVLLKIINRRGKPVSRIIVQSVQGGELGATDRDGAYLFRNLAGDDRIRVFFSSTRQGIIPAEGLDSLLVIMRGNNNFNYAELRNNQQVNIGYGTVSRRDNTMPVNDLDIEELVSQTSNSSLLDALRGRIAGLNIGTDGSAFIRGQRSLNSSNEPLVIVDGMEWGSLRDASDQLNIYDIKSVSVLKDGSMYGSRGANGVILITTK